MKARLALACLFGLSGCNPIAPAGPALTPPEVIADIHRLNGKVVHVEGWLGECNSLDCGLYASLEDAEIVEKNDWHSLEWKAAMDRRLSIGPSPSIDFFWSYILAKRKVTIRARVSDWCHQKNRFCFDRATDIDPIQVYPSL